MLTKRLIPCLDVKEGRVVKGIQFLSLQDAGDPVELAALYNESGADELVFLDISATKEGRQTMIEIVRKVAASLSIPFTVGGGIRTVEDIRTILRAGADKVSLNSAAVQNPELISDAARIFGNQCIVAAIDAKYDHERGSYFVYTHGGQEKTERDVFQWANEAVDRGAGEILLTSMDRDGEKTGYELELTAKLSQTVSVPVIASGGAGKLQDFYDVLTIGQADAALAASLFHYRETTIERVKHYLKEKGVAIR